MKIFTLASGIVLASTQAFAAALPMDAPIAMGNVTAVCTGVGSAKDDPKFAAYPIRLEFSNGAAQFVANEHVKLMNNTGAVLAEFDCQGPWVLLQMPKGLYSVTRYRAGCDARTQNREGRTAGDGPEAHRDSISLDLAEPVSRIK
ncbi:MAG: hypothetical protein WDM89_13765 [Rhizomicrobium sp.]